MTLQIIRDQHTEACAQAMEVWVQAWDTDHRAGLILEAHKSRWLKAAKACPTCFGQRNGHSRPGNSLPKND